MQSQARFWRSAALTVWAIGSACNGSSIATSRDGSVGGNSGTGGHGEVTSIGGNTVAALTGGSSGTGDIGGGTLSTGGIPSTGGVPAAGGIQGGGGRIGTGGTVGSGGSASGSGGATSSGGSSSLGGGGGQGGVRQPGGGGSGSGGATSSGGSSSFGGSGGQGGVSQPSGTDVTFNSGQAVGQMSGSGWVSLGLLDSLSNPTCSGSAITSAAPCATTTTWNSTSALCMSGSIPAMPADPSQTDYDNNWGLEIGVNATNTVPSGTLGRTYSTVAFDMTGAPLTGLVAELHRSGDPKTTSYCSAITPGASVMLAAFNTSCYDGTGTALKAADVPNIDMVGVRVLSGRAQIAVSNLCLTGIRFVDFGGGTGTGGATGAGGAAAGDGDAGSVGFTLNRTAIDLGDIGLDYVFWETVTVTALTDLTGLVTGKQGPDLTLYPTSTCNGALAAGASCDVAVEFSPVAVGPAIGDAIVVSQGGVTETVPITANILLSAKLVASPTSVALAAAPGTSSAGATITIGNAGEMTTGTIDVAMAGPPGEFKVQSNACNYESLTAGATCAVTVVYTPAATTAAPEKAYMTITENGPGTSVASVVINGTPSLP